MLEFLKAYCLFCRTGAESHVKQVIKGTNKEAKTIIPVRVLQEKVKGAWIPRERKLLPGYMFIYAERELPFEDIKRQTAVYRILGYENGDRQLLGQDYEYAMWLYRHNGRIGASGVIIEGASVKVVDGPLLDAKGKIVRFDRHKRRAMVSFDFYGKTRQVSLSVMDLTPCEA